MTQDTPSIAAIVEGLSEAQKRACLAMTGEYAPVPFAISRQSIAAFVFKYPRLCEREWQDGCAQCTYYRLTPLGLRVQSAVRTALQEQSK